MRFASKTCQMSPQGICHGVLGWGQVEQMTSRADPATVPLANRELLCVAGDPDHTAVSVPLQQMLWDKLATTHIAKATGHLGQYRLHIFYREVCA